MTRTLVFIAFAGFILAVACIAGAIAMGGNALMHHHWRHWNVTSNDNISWDDGHHHAAGGGPAATREIAWPGGDKIEFDVPADVQYTQGPGPAKLVLSGPKDALDHIVLSNGQLKLNDDDDDFDGRISVVMTAPDVRRFSIDGDNTLTIDGYSQDDLAVDVSGHGTVTAKGKTRAMSVDISGSGDVDMSGLASQSAKADISGSGHASIAPTDEADVSISGSGEIDLMTHPAKLNSDVSGSGKIVEGGPTPTPATNATAAPATAAPANKAGSRSR